MSNLLLRMPQCFDFLMLQKKWPDQKDKVFFKLYDATTWGTNNCNAHILLNISKSEGNKTMKFGHLIKYNMTNIFLEISNSKYGGETILRLFYQNQIEHISRQIV